MDPLVTVESAVMNCVNPTTPDPSPPSPLIPNPLNTSDASGSGSPNGNNCP